MRFSRLLAPTMKEAPAHIETPEYQLLVRGGFIRQTAPGVFTFLPLGLRVLRKIEEIAREELEETGAQEVGMPTLLPRALWEETERWTETDDEMFRLQDRQNRDYSLAMTHEEVATDLVRKEVRSYRQLPLSLYQVGPKFRDEEKPRNGLVRTREFICADVYSFHSDEESLEKTFQDIMDAYLRILKRCGIEAHSVSADPGFIGGRESTMLVMESSSGSDTVFECPECQCRATRETASHADTREESSIEMKAPVEKVYTPGVSTIEDLCAFLKVTPEQTVKSMVFRTDNGLIAALVRGDREVSEYLLKKELGTETLRKATDEEIREFTGGEPGFSGPVKMKDEFLIADGEIRGMSGFVTGANEKDHHLINVVPGRDFTPGKYASIRKAEAGDACPSCGNLYHHYPVLELAHLFKLGTSYSKPMKALFDDGEGKEKFFVMGCYGLGLSRLVSAVIEKNRDKDGIIWPPEIAPYQVVVTPVPHDNPLQTEAAESLHKELLNLGIEAVLDDRDLRPGARFKDADLIGFPMRIVVGKHISEGKVEVKNRRDGSLQICTLEEAKSLVLHIFFGIEQGYDESCIDSGEGIGNQLLILTEGKQ